MTLRLFIPFTIFFLSATAFFAQTPSNIILKSGNTNGPEFMACADQFAGTITLANFVGQSNDTDLDTVFLCFNDQIDIVHNGDQDLTGDPDPTSAPGISYAFYNCEPSTGGPNLTNVLTETCILDTPPPADGIWINNGGTIDGNVTFANDGTIQGFFNGGDPALIWFAPITVDDFPLTFEEDPNTNELGPCVNVNTNAAFAVVYLNQIEVTNADNNAGVSGCEGSFDVSGGLPEFDGSNYTVDIALTTDPTVKAIILNSGNITDGSTVRFLAPRAGVYDITVSDGKSCEREAFISMSMCESITLNIGDATATAGQDFCVPVTTGDDFLDVVSLQFSINWDETVLMFNGVQNLNPNLSSFAPSSFNNPTPGSLILSWNNLSGNTDLPNNVVLFEMCFNAIGDVGDSTDIVFANSPSIIEVAVDQGGGNTAMVGINSSSGDINLVQESLMLTFSQDSVECFGFTDGAFSVEVAGGVPPYQIQWQASVGGPVQGPANIMGTNFSTPNSLAAGEYNVTITDATLPNPITATETVEVFQNPDLEFLFNTNLPQCSGDSGTISVTLGVNSNPISDLTGYQFMWSTGDTATETDSIVAGMYTITVTDPLNCVFTEQTSLLDPPAINVTQNLTNASCSGFEDGIIGLSVSGGTPDANGNYTIEWKTIGNGLTFMNVNSNLNNLAPGPYPICITDGNGCEENIIVNLPADKVIEIALAPEPVNCFGESSGSVQGSVSTTGGIPATPYIFNWTGQPNPPIPNNTPATTQLTGLEAGIYIVTIQDQDGCETRDTAIITQPDELIASIVDTIPESCTPGNDGGFSVVVEGGTAPYFYNWDGNLVMDSIATGLSSGDYMVTVTDVNNCFVVLPVTISQPLPPEITMLENDTLNCINDMNGTLTVTAIGDIAGYAWSNTETNPTITNLGADSYTVTVTGTNGCEATASADVVEPLPLILDSVVTVPPICPGQGGGQISVFMSGGTGPYFYDWSPLDDFDGLNNSTAAGIIVTAGNYQIEVTDANLCPSFVVDVALSDPPSPNILFANAVPVSCPTGVCDGSVTATASLSTNPNETFNFIWPSGEQDNNTTASTPTQLCAGMQTVTVSYGNCQDSMAVTIPAPLEFMVDFDIDNVTCTGAADGEITANVTGATAPYNFAWSNMQTGNMISGLGVGDYTVLITDGNNCPFNATATILEPDPYLLLQSQLVDVSCNGFEDGQFVVVPQGGTGATTYTWENGIGGPNDTSVDGLAAGTYSVTGTDAQGCQDVLTFVIEEPAPITFELGDIAPILCNRDLTSITVVSATGGVGPYNFSVDNRSPLSLGLPQQVFAGAHVVTVFDVSNSECFADTSITVTEPPALTVTLPTDIEIELGDSLFQLNPIISSALTVDSFLWLPNDGLMCPGQTGTNCPNPIVNITEDQDYELIIIDSNGCTASALTSIEVDANRNVFIPNIFSPNDDGRNDIFRVYAGLGVENINFMRIYDRWGNFIFERNDIAPSSFGSDGWDGSFRGERLKPAVFLYMIEVQFLDGRILLYRGDITLIR